MNVRNLDPIGPPGPGIVARLGADGRRRWQLMDRGGVGGIAIAGSSVYIGGDDYVARARLSDGTFVWRRDPEPTPFGIDGTVPDLTRDAVVVCDPTGEFALVVDRETGHVLADKAPCPHVAAEQAVSATRTARASAWRPGVSPAGCWVKTLRGEEDSYLVQFGNLHPAWGEPSCLHGQCKCFTVEVASDGRTVRSARPGLVSPHQVAPGEAR